MDQEGKYALLRFFYYKICVHIRLLNFDIGQWCHLNCALWSSDVYETVSGSLVGVDQALKRSINTECIICKQKGGSVKCIFQRCNNTYHFKCANDNGCVFYKNKVRPKIFDEHYDRSSANFIEYNVSNACFTSNSI